jgi:hypothetical protein
LAPPVIPGSALAPAILAGFGGAAGCVRTDAILPACEAGRDARLAVSPAVPRGMATPFELVSL